MQDIPCDGLLTARMTDAQPHPCVIRSGMLMDRTQPVMTRMTAALLKPQLTRRKIQFVVKHGQVACVELIEPQRLTHRLPRKIHEGLGLEQDDLLPAQCAFTDGALKFTAPWRKAMILGDPLHRHKADIVPGLRVFRARITKAGKDHHGERPFHAWGVAPSCRNTRRK